MPTDPARVVEIRLIIIVTVTLLQGRLVGFGRKD